jgi:DNA-binding MarR family transcriptional regulator
MKYKIITDLIGLIEEFESEHLNDLRYSNDAEGFKKWIAEGYKGHQSRKDEPTWEGKENGRSPESVIATLLVHLNRYAKNYSKSAITGSEFSSQDDFSYLINLKSAGEISKMDLIKKNAHDKPAGMQIINRLVARGWISQTGSEQDKRRKLLKITAEGLGLLERQMDKIRKATQIVSAELTYNEKMDLIRLLTKLHDFHEPIYNKNAGAANLLNVVLNDKKQ